MVILGTFILSLILTPLVGRAGRSVGLMDSPSNDGLKIHTSATPTGGGIAVVAAMLTVLVWLSVPLPWKFVVATSIALLVGVIDDLGRIPIAARVAAQALSGFLLGLELFPGQALAIAAATVITVGLVNATNILDGQDGLVGGIGSLAFLGIAMVGQHLDGSTVGTEFSLAAAGAVLGFLVWNRPKARLFLGNNGAYAVGTTLAIAVLVALSHEETTPRHGIALAMTCGIFLFELAFTIARRTLLRTAVSAGDRDHSYDLLARFIPRNQVTYIAWATGGVLTVAAVATVHGPPSVGILISFAILCAALAIGLWLFKLAKQKIEPHPTRSP